MTQLQAQSRSYCIKGSVQQKKIVETRQKYTDRGRTSHRTRRVRIGNSCWNPLASDSMNKISRSPTIEFLGVLSLFLVCTAKLSSVNFLALLICAGTGRNIEWFLGKFGATELINIYYSDLSMRFRVSGAIVRGKRSARNHSIVEKGAVAQTITHRVLSLLGCISNKAN